MNRHAIKNAEDFGLLIRERRRERGLTQDELAARIGVARRFIIDLESGKPTCQIGKAITAAVEIGIRLGDDDRHTRFGAQPLDIADGQADDDDLALLPKF